MRLPVLYSLLPPEAPAAQGAGGGAFGSEVWLGSEKMLLGSGRSVFGSSPPGPEVVVEGHGVVFVAAAEAPNVGSSAQPLLRPAPPLKVTCPPIAGRSAQAERAR